MANTMSRISFEPWTLDSADSEGRRSQLWTGRLDLSERFALGSRGGHVFVPAKRARCFF